MSEHDAGSICYSSELTPREDDEEIVKDFVPPSARERECECDECMVISSCDPYYCCRCSRIIIKNKKRRRQYIVSKKRKSIRRVSRFKSRMKLRSWIITTRPMTFMLILMLYLTCFSSISFLVHGFMNYNNRYYNSTSSSIDEFDFDQIFYTTQEETRYAAYSQSLGYSGSIPMYGNMFDVIAHEDVILTGMDLHLVDDSKDDTTDTFFIHIWSREGGYDKHESSMDDWRLIYSSSSSSVEPQGSGNPTSLPESSSLFESIIMNHGEIHSFYVHTNRPRLMSSECNSGDLKQYYSGIPDLEMFPGVGFVSNTEFSVMEGLTPSICWNGSLKYEKQEEEMINIEKRSIVEKKSNSKRKSKPNYREKYFVTVSEGGLHEAYGAMFDISASSENAIIIHSFDIHTSATDMSTVVVWTRSGTYTANTMDSIGWTLVCNVEIQANGKGVPTPIPKSKFTPVMIEQGGTQAFYVTLTKPDMIYEIEDVSVIGDVSSANEDMSFRIGSSMEQYPFGGTPENSKGAIWNGIIKYEVIPPVTLNPTTSPPSPFPSKSPTNRPSSNPTKRPTPQPTRKPTRSPIVVSKIPPSKIKPNDDHGSTETVTDNISWVTPGSSNSGGNCSPRLNKKFSTDLIFSDKQYGNMFSIQVKEYALVVTSIDVLVETLELFSFRIWTKEGSFKMNENKVHKWTLIASGQLEGKGPTRFTFIPAGYFESVNLEPNSVQSFYVASDTPVLLYEHSISAGFVNSEQTTTETHHSYSSGPFNKYINILESNAALQFPFGDDFAQNVLWKGIVNFKTMNSCANHHPQGSNGGGDGLFYPPVGVTPSSSSSSSESVPTTTPKFNYHDQTSSPHLSGAFAPKGGNSESNPSVNIVLETTIEHPGRLAYERLNTSVGVSIKDSLELLLLDESSRLFDLAYRDQLVVQTVKSVRANEIDERDRKSIHCLPSERENVCTVLEILVTFTHSGKVSVEEIQYNVLLNIDDILGGLNYPSKQYIGPTPYSEDLVLMAYPFSKKDGDLAFSDKDGSIVEQSMEHTVKTFLLDKLVETLPKFDALYVSCSFLGVQVPEELTAANDESSSEGGKERNRHHSSSDDDDNDDESSNNAISSNVMIRVFAVSKLAANANFGKVLSNTFSWNEVELLSLLKISDKVYEPVQQIKILSLSQLSSKRGSDVTGGAGGAGNDNFLFVNKDLMLKVILPVIILIILIILFFLQRRLSSRTSTSLEAGGGAGGRFGPIRQLSRELMRVASSKRFVGLIVDPKHQFQEEVSIMEGTYMGH